MKTDILFDLDGTLTNPFVGITKSVQYALKSFGIEVEDNGELDFFIGPPLGETFMKYYGFSERQAEKAVEKYREYFAPKGIFENELYDGVTNMLDRLRKSGKRLFIATGKPTVFSKQIAEHFGFADRFAGIYGIELSDLHRCKADTVASILTDFSISPENAVMVGDRIFDIEAGKQNRLTTVGVSYGFAKKGELEGQADYIVDRVDELEKLLLRL